MDIYEDDVMLDEYLLCYKFEQLGYIFEPSESS